MVDGLALLTEAAEQVALSRILRSFRPDLTIWPVSGIDELRTIDASVLRTARLVAFASGIVVPADLLARFGHGACNFHPGPPNYPGWAPAHFALYDRADTFGVTFHAMAEQVDSGAILDVVSFPIPQGCSVMRLGELAYAHLLQLFEVWAEPLAYEPSLRPRCAQSWSGRTNTRRSYSRPATSRWIFPGTSCGAACAPSAAIITGSRRRSICTVSPSRRHLRRAHDVIIDGPRRAFRRPAEHIRSASHRA